MVVKLFFFKHNALGPILITSLPFRVHSTRSASLFLFPENASMRQDRSELSAPPHPEGLQPNYLGEILPRTLEVSFVPSALDRIKMTKGQDLGGERKV